MISRHWTGVTKPGKENDYIAHLLRTTFPSLLNIPGFIRANILQRAKQDGTEFLIITEWENMESIHAFAGDDPSKAVVPQVARDMLLRFDETARHYDVAHTTARQ